MTASAVIPMVMGILVAFVGSGGIVFAALKYRRDEAQGFVDIMRGLNDELQDALERTRKERDCLITEVDGLRIEVRKLRQLVEAQ